ncbi:MAG TPA: RNA polymerase sigma factor [Gemmatimonadota bacterium]|nr:RNA polymerase sigma factor [Gemmatimonadota bacterium]
MTEGELIERARNGDRAAEREIYEAHVERVYCLAFRMTGRDDLAQDFAQETFVKAFGALPDFRGESALGTWLHAIATRVVLNGLRKVKRVDAREVPLEAAEGRGSADRRPEPDLSGRLETALDGLSDDYRMVVVMHDMEGYTHEEIGAALGIAEGSSKARLSRARARLRNALQPWAAEWLG